MNGTVLDRIGVLPDPRRCPGHYPDGSVPIGENPNGRHKFSDEGYANEDGYCCWYCGITRGRLRDNTREWRYEHLINANTHALNRIADLLSR